MSPGVPGCTRVYQGVPGSNRVYQGVTRCTRVYQGVPGRTRAFINQRRRRSDGTPRSTARVIVSLPNNRVLAADEAATHVSDEACRSILSIKNLPFHAPDPNYRLHPLLRTSSLRISNFLPSSCFSAISHPACGRFVGVLMCHAGT